MVLHKSICPNRGTSSSCRSILSWPSRSAYECTRFSWSSAKRQLPSLTLRCHLCSLRNVFHVEYLWAKSAFLIKLTITDQVLQMSFFSLWSERALEFRGDCWPPRLLRSCKGRSGSHCVPRTSVFRPVTCVAVPRCGGSKSPLSHRISSSLNTRAPSPSITFYSHPPRTLTEIPRFDPS